MPSLRSSTTLQFPALTPLPSARASRPCWTGSRATGCAASSWKVQIGLRAGHDFLKSLGISLIPATAPDFFTEDTPTAVLVRQMIGAIAQFEKTSLVAKLKAARDRKKVATGKCGGAQVI
jgi:hypothetical protein